MVRRCWRMARAMIFAVTGKLQVGEAAENPGHPQKGQTGKDQEAEVDFILLHGSLQSALTVGRWFNVLQKSGEFSLRPY